MKASICFLTWLFIITGARAADTNIAPPLFLQYVTYFESFTLSDKWLRHARFENPSGTNLQTSGLSFSLKDDQIREVREWIERFKIFSLPANYSARAWHSGIPSLTVRVGTNIHLVTFDTSHPAAHTNLHLPLQALRRRFVEWSPPPQKPGEFAEARRSFFPPRFGADEQPLWTAALEELPDEILLALNPRPFKSVIEATTQHRLLDFDPSNSNHVALKQRLVAAATTATQAANREGIFESRANEAGNAMESYVRVALRSAGLEARVPVTTAGNARSAGYPDIEIAGDPPCYLELKTYSKTTANTTQRSFYYSSSAHPKVTQDALHLLLAFQMEKAMRDGTPAFIPVSWKLITLQDLQVDLKFEFNQSNRGLYGRDAARALLDEGATP